MKRSTKITIGIIIFFVVIAAVVIGRYAVGLHFKKKFSKRSPPGVIVKVVVNGKKEPLSVAVDDSILSEDRDMVEDLILAAMKNAFDNAEKESAEKMKSVTGGMPNIPGF